MSRKLDLKFYDREALDVAKDLLGMTLVRMKDGRRRSGRIVETEAYKGPEDLAAHSSRGCTPRCEVMFGPPGRAYVYFIYGFWHCVNVVVREAGVPHAILIRALEPLDGVTGKTSGPGLLCRALGIDRSLNGEDLRGNKLWIERPEKFTKPRIARAKRIGVDYARHWAEKPWRFYVAGSPFVSRKLSGPGRI